MSRENENVTSVEVVDSFVGKIFDKRFRVDERLAAGGFGAIYRATHVKSGHPIALKILHPSLASDLGVLARFRREGTTLTSLRNPHTITAYEFGQVDKTLFIVLELLHGESLFEHYEANGPLEWKRVVHIAKQVCDSLEEAHALGVVHRDLKPTNIHLEEHDDDPDFVKVLDFGIAKILRGSDLDSADITNAGQMIGTLDYMSPEQMVGGQVTGQSDIYTLGIVMYEMIAGTRPFPESANPGAALAAMLKTTPEPLYLRAPVPQPLDAIVMRCLERETAKRFRTVSELHAALEHVAAEGTHTATVQLAKASPAPADDDATTVTPPPEKLIESLKTPKVQRKATPVQQWDDDDEHAPTTTRRPDGKPDAAVATTRRPDSKPDAASALPSNPQLPTSPSSPPRPTPRPLASRHIENPPVPLVVAPFSQTPRIRPATGPIVQTPAASALGVAPTSPMEVPAEPTAIGPGMPPHPPLGAPRPSGPSGGHAPRPSGPSGGHAPSGPSGGHAPSGPSGGHAPVPDNALGTLGHSPARVILPATPLPATPVPPYSPTPPPAQRAQTTKFDMASIAARDAALRRIVWIIVLVLGAGAGFLVATQL